MHYIKLSKVINHHKKTEPKNFELIKIIFVGTA